MILPAGPSVLLVVDREWFLELFQSGQVVEDYD
jgi:hypothetical protein